MKNCNGWNLDREYPEYEPSSSMSAYLKPYTVITIVPSWNQLQIMTHGSCYTCPMQMLDGVSYFKFKGEWHKTKDYTTSNTRINDISTNQ